MISNRDDLPDLDTPELRETVRMLRERRERAKRAERAYPIEGADFVWWDERPPTKAWNAHGLLVAVMPAPPVAAGLNGYVLLPKGHPWRDADLQGGDMPDGVEEPDVHGGVTLGPRVTGWVGFDTGHAFDLWTRRALGRLVDDGLATTDDLDGWFAHRDLLASHGLPEDRSWEPYPPICWTGAAVIAETIRFAEQVARVAAKAGRAS